MSGVPSAYNNTGGVLPDWLNKGDNAWQMTAATLVGMQGMPGLVILYASIVKKKWAVNSAFMALYAFAAAMLCWVLWAYKMAFGHKLLPMWGKAGPALDQFYLVNRSALPESTQYYKNGNVETPEAMQFYPMATMIYFQGVFAAVTIILIAGSLLGRMNFLAWVIFVPLWLTFSYTVSAFSLWGGGFLFHWGVIDYSGGYVVHVSAGTAGFVAAYWVGPRLNRDRESFVPNNIVLTVAGAGLLWMGWAGFNGGDPFAANIDSSMAVLNTHVCTATSLLMWSLLDTLFLHKPSIIGAIQGMITGLVCITPAAGVVQGWAAIVMGILSGSVPWFTMTVMNKKLQILRSVDDTLGVVHTHAVAGILGGILTGLFAEPTLCSYFLPVTNSRGAFYGGVGGAQLGKQIVGACFVVGWNVVCTTLILLGIRAAIPLRMPEEKLLVGDNAVHGEEAYALWGDSENYNDTEHGFYGAVEFTPSHSHTGTTPMHGNNLYPPP